VNRFYFDYNATTPVSGEVLEAFLPCLNEVYGNASSIHHYGQAAKQKLEKARSQVAHGLGCHPNEIVFVSGGTESDNLAILGTARGCRKTQRHVITTAIEHPAVLNTCQQLEREGVAVTYLEVGGDGVVDPDGVRKALRPETVLISVMHANNELGTVQPIVEIARIAREAGVCLHVDGVQALGKIPVDVGALGADLYSASGHKIYAPKGVGVLYVRGVKAVKAGTVDLFSLEKRGNRSTVPMFLAPILYGGHGERDRRPGTDNVAGAVALGRAVEWATENLAAEAARISGLRDWLEGGILEQVPGAAVNGRGALRTPNTSNIRFDGVGGEAMVIALDLRGFAVSTGAACSSGAVEPSHVLTAIGLTPEQARSGVRFSLGRYTTIEQVEALVAATRDAAAHLRKLSPAYHAHV
jgi:cysteine desulfurase